MVQIWNFQGPIFALYPEKYQMLPLGIPASDDVCRNPLGMEPPAIFPGIPQGQAIANCQRLTPEVARPSPKVWKNTADFYIRHTGEIDPNGITKGIPG